MDAITLLKNDHKTVEQLFKRFEKAGDRAFVEKRRIVDRIVEELSVHAAIEEQVFYPMAREAVPNTEDIALESLEEHHVVKWLLAELDEMDPEEERFDAKVSVLMEMVRHHVDEEETECFPKVRDALGRSDLAELGEIMTEAKKTAPTRPHPEAPDSPPANGLVGAISGAGDRIADQINGVAQGTVTAVRDLAARVTGGTHPTTRPTGSSVTRSTAQKVRRVADAATDAVEETARSAATNSRTTARSAKTSAKRTAGTAKRAASKTRAVAKSSAR